MKTILQRKGSYMVPFDPDSLKRIRQFPEMKPIEFTTSDKGKPRSLQQLRLYWACCSTVAENLEPGTTKEDVDFEVKMFLRHFKHIRTMPDGTVCVEVDSISYDRLDHLEACNFFDRAFPVLANMIGVAVHDLLKNAEG